MIPKPFTDDRLLLAIDDYINPKTGKKIFGCARVTVCSIRFATTLARVST
jgi:hypothetical protein